MAQLDRKASLRLIFSKLQKYLAVQNNLTSVVSNGTTNNNGSESLSSQLSSDDTPDPDFIEKLNEYRQKRESYVNGTVDIGVHFGRTYVALGVIAIILNLTILIILISHRRQVLRNVFYLLIFNFALIDSLKAVCLITYALRMIKSPSLTKSAMITSFKFDQYMTLIFRFCNMATILNLLMITLNEFIFIKFPLRYHRIVNKKSAIFCILLNWTLCLAFTIGSTFAKGTGDRVFVSANYTSDFSDNMSSSSFDNKNIKRNAISSDKMEIHYIFAFTLTAFCMICLLLVIICYAVFFRVIREIRMYDARLYNDANRRMSEMSVCSDNNNFIIHGTVDERKIKRQLLKRYKYVLVIGLVICIYMLYLLTYSGIQIFQYLHLSNEKSFAADPVEHRKSYVVRWILQILVGLHSIFQPLCYFRMKEFRQFINRAFGYPCKSYGHHGHRDAFNSLMDTVPSVNVTNHHPNHNKSNQKRWFNRLLRNSDDFSSRRNSYYCDPPRRISNESYRQINGTINKQQTADHSLLPQSSINGTMTQL